MQNNNPIFKPLILLLWSLWMIFAFGYQTLWPRLTTRVEGTVVESTDLPPNHGPRYVTQYTIRGSDGQNYAYLAGPTDASLPRSMPTGTIIKKQKWHLSFEKNGRRVDDFAVTFYIVLLGGAAACLIWSLRLWGQQTS